MDLPVHENSASPVKSILNELVAGFKMLEQIFIIYIVHFHHFVGKVLEELFVQRQL